MDEKSSDRTFSEQDVVVHSPMEGKQEIMNKIKYAAYDSVS